MTIFDTTRDDAVNLKSSHSQALGNPECRLCNAALTTSFVDLGMSPLCESILSADQIDQMEPYYPLHVLVCNNCFLVQLREYVNPENIFSEYDYFSSYSSYWVEHARRYCEMIKPGSNSVRTVRVLRFQAMIDTSFSTSFRWASLSRVLNRPPTWLQSLKRRIFQRLWNFSAWNSRGASLLREGTPTSSSATTCSRRCLTSTTSLGQWRFSLARTE